MHNISLSWGFKTEWYEIKGTKQIFLLSNDVNFIQQTFDLIVGYTKKIDPKAPLKFSKIEEIPEGSREYFTHRIDLSAILPRALGIFYGQHAMNRISNCHGAALLGTGIFPMVSFCDSSPIDSVWVENKLEIIALENVCMGDLVFLEENPHSFVFLSHQLCLSMNGRGSTLELYPSSYVLEKYGYPKDALITSNSTQKIKVFRRKEIEEYFEEIIPCLTDYMGFYTDLMNTPNPKDHLRYGELPIIEKKLKNFMLSAQANPTLSISSKDAIKALYYICRNWMPAGAITEESINDHHSQKRTPKEEVWTPLWVLGAITAVIGFLWIELGPIRKPN